MTVVLSYVKQQAASAFMRFKRVRKVMAGSRERVYDSSDERFWYDSRLDERIFHILWKRNWRGGFDRSKRHLPAAVKDQNLQRERRLRRPRGRKKKKKSNRTGQQRGRGSCLLDFFFRWSKESGTTYKIVFAKWSSRRVSIRSQAICQTFVMRRWRVKLWTVGDRVLSKVFNLGTGIFRE